MVATKLESSKLAGMKSNPQVETPTQVTSVSLDAASKELLDLLAQREERSRSQVMRRAIRLYANREQETTP